MMPMPARLLAALSAAVLLASSDTEPLGAQQARTTSPTRVIVTRGDELNAIIQRLQVVARQLEQEQQDNAERRRLLEELGNLMLQLSEAQKQYAPREGVELHPEAYSMPRTPLHAKVLEQSRQLMLSEGMPGSPQGWLGLNVSAPYSMRLENGEQYVRFHSYPQVVSVDPSSPADRAGIRRGDTLLAYNGTDVRREIAMRRLLVPESRLAVRLRRDGQLRDVALVVATAPQNIVERRFDLKFPEASAREMVMLEATRAPSAPRAPRAAAVAQAPVAASATSFRVPFSPNVMLGARVETVSEEMHDATGLARGVLVMEVAEGSYAHAAGLRQGDVITHAGGRSLQSVGGLRQALRGASDESLDLSVQRRKAKRKVTLRW